MKKILSWILMVCLLLPTCLSVGAKGTEAKVIGLIPKQMLYDDLTQNVTRAEFAAIAVQLQEAIFGELFWRGGYIIDIINKYGGYNTKYARQY